MAKKRKGGSPSGTSINISLHVGDHIPHAKMQEPGDDGPDDFRPSGSIADSALNKMMKDKGGRSRGRK